MNEYRLKGLLKAILYHQKVKKSRQALHEIILNL